MVDINAQGSLLSCRSLERASRSIRCLPFTKQFYQDAQERGLDASTVLQLPKVYRLDSVRWFTAANSVEDAFGRPSRPRVWRDGRSAARVGSDDFEDDEAM